MINNYASTRNPFFTPRSPRLGLWGEPRYICDHGFGIIGECWQAYGRNNEHVRM